MRSQQRFSAAQATGKFDEEIVAIELTSRKGLVSFAKDEANRPDTTSETLARLKPAFRKDGKITAGNAPGFNSGAVPNANRLVTGNSHKALVTSVEASLNRLKTDRIDIYWAHHPDGITPV